MEKIYPAAVFWAKYHCDHCETGEMIYTFRIRDRWFKPLEYEHKCTNCGFRQYLKYYYPNVKHELAERY